MGTGGAAPSLTEITGQPTHPAPAGDHLVDSLLSLLLLQPHPGQGVSLRRGDPGAVRLDLLNNNLQLLLRHLGGQVGVEGLHVVGHPLDVDSETDGTLVPRVVFNDHVLVFIFRGLGLCGLLLLLAALSPTSLLLLHR